MSCIFSCKYIQCIHLHVNCMIIWSLHYCSFIFTLSFITYSSNQLINLPLITAQENSNDRSLVRLMFFVVIISFLIGVIIFRQHWPNGKNCRHTKSTTWHRFLTKALKVADHLVGGWGLVTPMYSIVNVWMRLSSLIFNQNTIVIFKCWFFVCWMILLYSFSFEGPPYINYHCVYICCGNQILHFKTIDLWLSLNDDRFTSCSLELQVVCRRFDRVPECYKY